MRFVLPALLACLLALPAAARAEEKDGLPIPRFVSLKSDEVNVRTGPGERYPISWVYKRDHLPVEIIEEFDHWRKVRDFEGAEGWINKSLLDGRRTVLIMKEVRVLRRTPEDKSPPLLRAAPMVIGKLLECKDEWCRVQIESRKGWLRKKQIWGVYVREEFGD